METINDRMEMLVNERFEGNKAAFAKAIGMAPTGLSNYLGNKRRSKPSVDMVAKIVVSLNVDARWLLTGEDSSKHHEQAIANGESSVAVAHNTGSISATSGDNAALQERIAMLEKLLDERGKLLDEKERLIKILMEKK